MPSFYTVRLKRLRVSYHYEDGKLVREDREEIEAVYSDLPFQTAQSYASNFPDAKPIIERQYEGGRARIEPGRRRIAADADAPVIAVEAEVEETPVLPVAGYGDLVNALVERDQ